MNCTQGDVIGLGARWLGFLLSILLASLSWYCLLYDVADASILSLGAFVCLVLSLFVPRIFAMPVSLCLLLLEKILVYLQSVVLFFVFFLIVTPLGLIIGIFDSESFSKDRLQRSRKYRRKSPGSYWSKHVGFETEHDAVDWP